MQSIDKELSARLSFAAFLCACMVVCIHSVGEAPAGSVEWWFFRLLGGCGISRMAVPFFFLLAGFFFAGGMNDTQWYLPTVKKRFRTLVVPLFAWGLIFLILRTVLLKYSNWIWYSVEDIQSVGFENHLRLLSIHPWKQGLFGQLWFLKSLFYVVLISPIFLLLKRKILGLVLLTVLFCAYGVITSTVGGGVFVYGFSLKGLFYFAVGAYLRNFPLKIRLGLLFTIVACITTIGLRIIQVLFTRCGLVAGVVDAVAIPITMVAFWLIICNLDCSRAAFLGKYAFPIYLLHPVIMLLFRPVFLPRGWLNSPVTWIFVAAAIILVCCFVSWALHRLVPRVAGVIFGGR